jgi:hypothetical protein
VTGNDAKMSIQPASRGAENQDHYLVRRLTTGELERTRRQLKANLGLLNPDSPAHVPIESHMRAIDAELTRRVGNPQDSEECDPLTTLKTQYAAEWNVRHPGKYVADHRRLDVTLVSDSVPGLTAKLRAFAELIKEFP